VVVTKDIGSVLINIQTTFFPLVSSISLVMDSKGFVVLVRIVLLRWHKIANQVTQSPAKGRRIGSGDMPLGWVSNREI
jgi:hypothetical protein